MVGFAGVQKAGADYCVMQEQRSVGRFLIGADGMQASPASSTSQPISVVELNIP